MAPTWLTGGENNTSATHSAGDDVRPPRARRESSLSQSQRLLQSLTPTEQALLSAGERAVRRPATPLSAPVVELDDGDEVPRLVHRLDAETSGVLLLARSRHCAVALMAMFKAHAVQKTYWTLTVGVPSPRKGLIEAPLPLLAGADNRPAGGVQSATTRYAVLDVTADAAGAWVELSPATGRKHQLRRHLAHQLGCPVVGDPLYDANDQGGASPAVVAARRAALYRAIDVMDPTLHLHARALRFPHPMIPDTTVAVVAPLGPHMTRSWRKLKLPV